MKRSILKTLCAVAALTAASGIVVAVRMYETHTRRTRFVGVSPHPDLSLRGPTPDVGGANAAVSPQTCIRDVAPSAATYCCPAERLLPSVASDRSRLVARRS